MENPKRSSRRQSHHLCPGRGRTADAAVVATVDATVRKPNKWAPRELASRFAWPKTAPICLTFAACLLQAALVTPNNDHGPPPPTPPLNSYNPNYHQNYQQPQGFAGHTPQEHFFGHLEQLRRTDTCGTIYTSKLHGYDIREYDIVTNDRHKLKIHRIIHPEQLRHGEPKNKRKPYLLVHGLIGSSASYVLNVDDHYRAPETTFSVRKQLVDLLQAQASFFKHDWQSVAQTLQVSSDREQRNRWAKHEKSFAKLIELDYDGDRSNFAREYRQAYRKFQMPKDAIGHTSNSLAFTLSNFGYDVWLINLRGNEYSRGYEGPLTPEHAEYWDFNIETLVKEDLMATINFIMREVDCTDPIGLVTYSFSGAQVLNLLTKFPTFFNRVEPVVMLAPTLLTATKERGKTKYVFKALDKVLSKNGPFPTLGRSFSPKKCSISAMLSPSKLDKKVEWLACKVLPIASKLCSLLETVLHGKRRQVTTVRGLLVNNDRSAALLKRDHECGQTSKAILHQIFENLNNENISPNFMPSNAIKMVAKTPLRRSFILIHSSSDDVATLGEVERIKSSALRTLTLLDYVITAPDFGHSDFLFSHQNQFLVNAEVARQLVIYDLLAYRSNANREVQVPRGF